MTTLFIVRHGRSTANTAGILAGRMPGVQLDEQGTQEAQRAGARLSAVGSPMIVSSPLERTKTTAKVISRQLAGSTISMDRNFIECDYGDWSGRKIKELSKQKLWREIQERPSGVTFPRGESMAGMAARASAAVRAWNERVSDEGRRTWVLVSHGDVIKAIIADALGMHLDNFQRINVDPGSISVISYSSGRGFVLAVNTTEGDLSRYVERARKKPKPIVGGSTGR